MIDDELYDRQEAYAVSTGQLSVYEDENWEQLDVEDARREVPREECGACLRGAHHECFGCGCNCNAEHDEA